MKIYKHIFRHNGVSQYNDDVFPALFDLANNDYAFKIKPNEETKHWRLGIALSTDKEFEFRPNEGRYNNNGLKYIEINVGDKVNGLWQFEDKISIGSYYFKEFESNPKVNTGYHPYSQVEFRIEKENSQSIRASYKSESIYDYRSFKVPGYRYFKLFAWADEVPFELEVEIKSQNSADQAAPPSQFAMTDNFPPVIEVEELAKEIAEILKLLNDDKGNMFGIFGRWGRGKTRLWNEIWSNLKSKEEDSVHYSKVEFHAWKYQDTPASWAYLYEVLSEKYITNEKIEIYRDKITKDYHEKQKRYYFLQWIKKFWRYTYSTFWKLKFTLFQTVKLNYYRKGITPLITFLLTTFLLVFWIFFAFRDKLEILKYIIEVWGLITVLKILYLYFQLKPRASTLLKKYTLKVSFQAYLGLQAEIQKEIVYLLSAWIKEKDVNSKKIVLFVDDIDRCSEDKIIQVVDALKVMLENPEICKRLLVVAALDERVLRMAIRFKYQKITTEAVGNSHRNSNETKSEHEFEKNVAREYIDKLFIGGVRLGELDTFERVAIFDNIIKGKIGPQNSVISNDYPGRVTDVDVTKQEQVFKPFDDFERIKGINVLEPEKDAQISLIEYSQIRNVLTTFALNSTPRSIRIYYYRYLLAKKIMAYKLINNQLFYSQWSEYSQKEILPVLILYYTIDTNAKPFNEEYEKLENTGVIENLRLQISKWDFHISPTLYKKLLEIVEMVVPY